jgi:hypothetical protein
VGLRRNGGFDNIVFLQEIVPSVVEGNGTEAGHVISTTIGGRDGQPKQVSVAFIPSSEVLFSHFEKNRKGYPE